MKDELRAKLLDALLGTVIDALSPSSVARPLLAVQAFAQRLDGTSIASPDVSDEERDQMLSEVERVIRLLERRQQP